MGTLQLRPPPAPTRASRSTARRPSRGTPRTSGVFGPPAPPRSLRRPVQGRGGLLVPPLCDLQGVLEGRPRRFRDAAQQALQDHEVAAGRLLDRAGSHGQPGRGLSVPCRAPAPRRCQRRLEPAVPRARGTGTGRRPALVAHLPVERPPVGPHRICSETTGQLSCGTCRMKESPGLSPGEEVNVLESLSTAGIPGGAGPGDPTRGSPSGTGIPRPDWNGGDAVTWVLSRRMPLALGTGTRRHAKRACDFPPLAPLWIIACVLVALAAAWGGPASLRLRASRA